jgi:hypothetical protein
MAANFTRRSRHDSIFYFRRRIPNDLHALGLPRRIVPSLHTADRRAATMGARRLAAASDSLFARIRAMPKNKDFSRLRAMTFRGRHQSTVCRSVERTDGDRIE